MNPLFCSQGHENPSGSHFCKQCGEKIGSPTGIQRGMILGERYRIERELGRGGFGKTYLARDVNRFDEVCVLKEFAPQVRGTYALEKGAELFEREAGILYKLQHHQIPRFREMFRTNYDNEGHLFLVQDYVEGQNYSTLLKNRLVHNRTFSEADVTQLFIQLLPVLAYIHGQGVIHRDISPDNIILRNSDSLPVLIDFGGVKQIAANLESQFAGKTEEGTCVGKLGYAPDEQMQMGKAYSHSDLYALAVTGLVLLTGKEPAQLRDEETLLWKWQPYVTVSPTFTNVLEKMLAHRPRDRYQSAQEVLAALQNYQPVTPQPPVSTNQSPTVAVSPPAPTPTPTPTPIQAPLPTPQNHFLPYLLVTLGAIITMGVMGLLMINSLRPTEQNKVDNNNNPNNNTALSEPSNFSKYSPEEQQRKNALKSKMEVLNLNPNFYVSLIDELFFQQYPQQQGRQLSAEPEDAIMRENWDEISKSTLSKLEVISRTARAKMGNYSRSDLAQRSTEVNQQYLGSRALNDLTDARFFYIFPEQPRNKNIIEQPLGQVWQALAFEEAQKITNSRTLKEIKIPASDTKVTIEDTIQPGFGLAYIAQLKKSQLLKFKLESEGKVLVSLYPPTKKMKALLEDSSIWEWTGSLPDTGYYEIVVVSDDSRPVSYQISVDVQDVIPKPTTYPTPTTTITPKTSPKTYL